MPTVKLLGTTFVKLKVKIEGGEGMWGGDGNKEKKAEEEREEKENQREEEVRKEKMSLDIFYCVKLLLSLL